VVATLETNDVLGSRTQNHKNKLNADSLARAQHPQRAVRGGAAMRDLHRFIQGGFNFRMGPTRRGASDCVDDRSEFVVDPMSPLAQQQQQLFLRGKDANSVTILIQPGSFVLPVQDAARS
jgi:hypothetical protein